MSETADRSENNTISPPVFSAEMMPVERHQLDHLAKTHVLPENDIGTFVDDWVYLYQNAPRLSQAMDRSRQCLYLFLAIVYRICVRLAADPAALMPISIRHLQTEGVKEFNTSILSLLIRTYIWRPAKSKFEKDASNKSASRDGRAIRYALARGIPPEKFVEEISAPGNGVDAWAMRHAKLRASKSLSQATNLHVEDDVLIEEGTGRVRWDGMDAADDIEKAAEDGLMVGDEIIPEPKLVVTDDHDPLAVHQQKFIENMPMVYLSGDAAAQIAALGADVETLRGTLKREGNDWRVVSVRLPKGNR